MYHGKIINIDIEEKEKIRNWIEESFFPYLQLFDEDEKKHAHIMMVELNKVSDWIGYARLCRKNNDSQVIPIISKNLLETVPIAIDLQVPSLLIKPIHRVKFIRTIQRALENLENVKNPVIDYHLLFDRIKLSNRSEANKEILDIVYRRLIMGIVKNENELDQIKPYLQNKPMPNFVCFIQGLIHSSYETNNAGRIVQDVLKEHLRPVLDDIEFLPFFKHLVLLCRTSESSQSPKRSPEFIHSFLKAILYLQNHYGIHLFVGVGMIHHNPLLLSVSYKQAKKARHTPPLCHLSLRFYEEITNDEVIKKSIAFISHHYHEELSVRMVSNYVNLSYSYFSRLFKKETGMSFVDYVIFVRIQRAVWLLRHSSKSIEEIAFEIGFNTPNYFSAIFKKKVGISPSEYRATAELIFSS